MRRRLFCGARQGILDDKGKPLTGIRLYIILSKVSILTWVKYMLEEFLRRSALFDFYGALLTEKQRRCLAMSLFEDYSLSEIGDALGISRQAVHDMLHRAEQTMEEYETRLGLIARKDSERKALAQVYKELSELRVNDEAARKRLLKMIAPFAGVEDTK